MNGPSGSYLTAGSPEEIIATETAARTLTASSQTVMANLQRARTEQVNKESAARAAKQKADKAAADAKASQDAAVSALTESKRKFDEQREQVDRLAAERDAAQSKLACEAQLADAAGRRGQGRGDRWDPVSAGTAGPQPGPPAAAEWDGLGPHAAAGAQRQRPR